MINQINRITNLISKNKQNPFFFLHPHYFNLFVTKFSYWVGTLQCYWLAFFWRVSLGSHNRFRGKIIFRTLPNTFISTGNNCIFNSSHSSNLIGINTPCMISTLKRGAVVEIGNNCGFSGTVIGAAKYIKIGNNVRCGANTMITDTDWHPEDFRSGADAEVIIEDNVWLGYNVKILKGVSIGNNSLIGAGSIVTKNIPANVIAAGNPCKVIRHL